MNFSAEIKIMPLEEILDPQGKVVRQSLEKMGLSDISKVRIGKHIFMELSAASEAEAREKVDEACKKLLANLIVERYEFSLTEKAG